MRGRRNRNELEKRLRTERPQPTPAFLGETLRMLSRGRPATVGRVVSTRIAIAGVLVALGFAAFAGFGGLGYAGAAAHSLVSSVTKNTSGNTSTTTTNATAGNVAQAKPSSADDEYPQTTPICHRTGSQTHPFVIISVSNSALPVHKAHGDTLVGPGNTCPGPPIT